MKSSKQSLKLALIGAGPTGFGFVMQLAKSLSEGGKTNIAEITVFDIYGKYGLGAGLPYDPQTTDFVHTINTATEFVHDVFGSLRSWLEINQDAVKNKFAEIYQQRFEEKYFQRFGVEFASVDNPNQEQKNLLNHYKNIWRDIEKNYLNYDSASRHHPRILFGVRNIILFEQAVAEIQNHGIVVNPHPQTEIIDLEKSSSEANSPINLSYKSLIDGEEKVSKAQFDQVIIATGRWRMRDEVKPKHIPEVWPIDQFKQDFNQIIEAEISRRQSAQDDNKNIRIAIQSHSLTGFDAARTILEDALVQKEGYDVVVDMYSRSGVVQQTKANKILWSREVGGYPEGAKVDNEQIDAVAANQNGVIYCWQVALMMVRSAELCYKLESERNNDQEMAGARSITMREMVKMIIENAQIDQTIEITNNELDAIKGSASQQLEQFKSKFGLKLENVDYQPLISEIGQFLYGVEPQEQLKRNLEIAKNGDVKSGHVVGRAAMLQLDGLKFEKYLPIEELAFRYQFLSRYLDSFNNSMAIPTAERILQLHESGKLNLLVAEKNQDYEQYDLVVEAKGYTLDFAKNPSAFGQSMRKFFKRDKIIVADSAEEFNAKEQDLITRFGNDVATRMLSLFFVEDGKYYFSTGDFRRASFDFNGNQRSDWPVQEIIDENSNRIMSNVLIILPRDISPAVDNGAQICAMRFVAPNPQISVQSAAALSTDNSLSQNSAPNI